MNAREQKAAAKAFAEKWKGRSNEKSETHSFWLELLHDVYGVEKPTEFVFFEEKVTLMQSDELSQKFYIFKSEISIKKRIRRGTFFRTGCAFVV